jgi:hypothetical protein
MDDADRATPEIERYVLEAARQKRPPGPVPTGRCLHCDEIVGDDQRWCDAQCRDNWELTASRR